MSYAQTSTEYSATDYRQTYMAEPRYRAMVNDAHINRPHDFDFMQFRGLYARTRDYDPIGKRTMKRLNALSYAALSAEDANIRDTALMNFQAVVDQHLGNVEVIMLALSLSRRDRRFGNKDFFEWMRDGLIRTIVYSGDGKSLRGAYDVVTAGEEAILFHHLGMKRLKTTSNREHRLYYNMHDAQDLKTGRERTVFVNTSIPMRYLDAITEQRKRNYTIDIQKQ